MNNMTKIFKGFKQVSAKQFNDEQDKAGYLWFVRTEVPNGENMNDVSDDSYDIYFGSRQYGHFRAGEIDAIRTSIETLGGNVDAILATLETLTDVVEANTAAINALKEIDHDAYIAADETLKNELEGKIGNKVDKVDGSRLLTDVEGIKLANIAEGAQVNVIEEIKVNGASLDVVDKVVDITIDSPKVKDVDANDKVLTLTEDGLVKSEISLKYVSADKSEDGKPHISLFGKNGTTLIDSIDATDFVKDGMVESVELVENDENVKVLRITWNTSAGKQQLDVPVSELMDYYYAGNGLSFDAASREFSVKVNDNEKYLKVDGSGLSIDENALWGEADKKYDSLGAANTAEENAKKYADDNFVTIDGFNAFEAEYEEKLNNIAEGAQVNVIEGIKVNGIDANIDDNKVASLEIESDDIKLGTAITTDGAELKEDGSNLKYAADSKVSVVLQSIYSAVKAADAGGVHSVTASDKTIEVNSNDANNPTVRVRVSADVNNLLTVKDDGIFVAMYYDGDDAE